MNILITSVSNKVALVKAFKSALANETDGGKLIGIDINPYSAGLYLCDEHVLCPRLDSGDYYTFITELCKKQKIELIIPTRDADVLYYARHKKALEGELPLRVMTADEDTVELCEDKYLFYQTLKEKNIPTIASWTEKCKDITYPCLVKDRRGAAAQNIRICKDEGSLDYTLSTNPDPIIQEYIEGTEYTIDYFADFEGQPLFALPRIRVKVEHGESKVGLTVKHEAISQKSKELGQALKLIGHNILQCFLLKDGSIQFIEANPRFGGGSNLCFAAGLHSPTYLIRLLQNKKITIPPYKENLLMIRYSEDLFIDNDQTAAV